MKVIVDTDPGIDDAVALSMLLSNKNVEVVAITCVFGNHNVSQTAINTLKILEAFDRKDIPVYKGVEKGLMGSETEGTYYHGQDALGDVHNVIPDQAVLKEEHAVSAIVRLAQEHKGEITLIALGPLTNLAMALRMNSDLPKNIKDLYIMGGSYKGEGNTTMGAEFNFCNDPVAAYIVLEDFACKKYLISWELSKHPYLTPQDLIDYTTRKNKKSDFFAKIFANKRHADGWPSECDAVAMAAALDKDIIKDEFEVYATVCLEGVQTRGMVVLDRNSTFRQIGGKKEKNLTVVTEIDVEKYRKMVVQSTL